MILKVKTSGTPLSRKEQKQHTPLSSAAHRNAGTTQSADRRDAVSPVKNATFNSSI
ncbi:hypothetical protein ACFOZ0_26245 [Streptomyces yaanensis]|uniref:FXSXX-COOH protein n=1 Tax=Streptomyces yaanensis TaxID=1142239 RepID=A0ABV7SJ86_9ACTN|nr:hypothetical protein [Streptomyces sp. CGMCC 4.7035]WNC01680.1 hypothetical protein Q2K21_28450 [Streptomyces sp. CGMCC 4.7035]